MGRFRKICISAFLLSSFAYASPFEAPDPPPHHPVLEEWLETALRLAETRFEKWDEDLDRVYPSGFKGLQLHATPISEMRLPLYRRRARTLWLKKERLVRSSTPHLAELSPLMEEARELVGLHRWLSALDDSDWKKLLVSFDTFLQWRVQAAISVFNEAIDSHHQRHAPPTDYELQQLKRLYLEVWTTGAFWVRGRDHLIKVLISNDHWWGEPQQKHVAELEGVGSCRVALIRLADPSYQW